MFVVPIEVLKDVDEQIQYTYMRRLSLAALLLLTLATSGFAEKVIVDFDEKADFSHIRTYQWRTHPVFEKDPSLLQKFAVAIHLVQQSGNKELAKRGFHPTESNPDVYFTFFIVAEAGQEAQTTAVASVGMWSASPYGWYGGEMPVWAKTKMVNFVQGMLVLDVVDPKTSKLLWRATYSDEIRDMSNRDKNIDSAVKKALSKFPPKKK
jgi:hypothetical protein